MACLLEETVFHMSAITTLRYASLKTLPLKMSHKEVLFWNYTERLLIKVSRSVLFHRNAAGGNKKLYAIYDTR